MKKLILMCLTIVAGHSYAQDKSIKAADSIIVKAGKSSVIVVIRDSTDINTIRRYDMEALIGDAILQLQTKADSLRKVNGSLVYKYKKYPGLSNFREHSKLYLEPESDSIIFLRYRDRSRQLAQDELRWLKMQEVFLESDSEYDRKELKQIIKERADRLKEKIKELPDREDCEQFEFEFRADKENASDSDDTEDEGEEDDKKIRRTYQSTHFDFGVSNYLSAGKFPDDINAPYTVAPSGSSYLAVNNIYHTRIARRMFLEWGLGMSAHIFKFQNDSMRILKTGTGVDFSADTAPFEYRKSKLFNYYLQASFVPVIDFGGNHRKPGIFDGEQATSFRIGAGPYAGYRINSYSRRVYKEDGEKQRVRDHDNFFLNNFRYGIRLQIGYRETDLFFCYDLNSLFSSGKGPDLNAFSFGISF
jgi:hypothetical protein